MFENILKPNLAGLIEKSARLIATHSERLAARKLLLPARDKKQFECEQAAILREGCRLSRGPRGRYAELDLKCKQLDHERDNPIHLADREIEEAAKAIHRAHDRFIRGYAEWTLAMLKAAPHDEALVEYLVTARREIEAMSMKPLAEIVKAMEGHERKVASWKFAEEPKNMLPALRLQDLAASA